MCLKLIEDFKSGILKTGDSWRRVNSILFTLFLEKTKKMRKCWIGIQDFQVGFNLSLSREEICPNTNPTDLLCPNQSMMMTNTKPDFWSKMLTFFRLEFLKIFPWNFRCEVEVCLVVGCNSLSLCCGKLSIVWNWFSAIEFGYFCATLSCHKNVFQQWQEIRLCNWHVLLLPGFNITRGASPHSPSPAPSPLSF